MKPQQYKSFLVRLQRDEGHPLWRATLENAQTGERLRFADQMQMLRYLLNELADSPTIHHTPAEQLEKR